MSAIDALLLEIFAHKRPAFYADFESWLRSSRRFRQFAHTYRSKIRAKLNNARHAGALDDLRAELHTAALLFTERRFEVEYERYAATKQRGPDFTVTFKTHTLFNVEVRRLSSDPGRLANVICEKVGQLPSSIINLVWLSSNRPVPETTLLAATGGLRASIESNQDAYFQKVGFATATDFAKQYRRLSAIVLRDPAARMIWVNPQARHTVPSDLQSALRMLG